jgi:hypothetical protein
MGMSVARPRFFASAQWAVPIDDETISCDDERLFESQFA